MPHQLGGANIATWNLVVVEQQYQRLHCTREADVAHISKLRIEPQSGIDTLNLKDGVWHLTRTPMRQGTLILAQRRTFKLLMVPPAQMSALREKGYLVKRFRRNAARLAYVVVTLFNAENLDNLKGLLDTPLSVDDLLSLVNLAAGNGMGGLEVW